MNPTALRPHPDASVVPNMDPDEYNALVEDIAARGIQVPLEVTLDGVILDGRHRHMAAIALGLADVPTRIVTPDDEYVYMVLAALRRRDLTKSQKAMLSLELDNYQSARAQAQANATAGRGSIATPIGRSREVAGRAAGVSPRLVQDAIAIRDADPDLADDVLAGRVTVSAAARQVRREANRELARVTPLPTIHTADQRYRCIVIDPPWDPSDEGDVDQMGRARPAYATMPIADVERLPVAELADDGCHLYLWITNRSLPKGFRLLESWGFRYITTLTWCKPSIGVGNYFRNNTEHVLFGVKGSLPLLYQDTGTWFAAPRGPAGHSSKPVEFFDMVNRVSPGPRLEMFARGSRDGFVTWGAEAA